MPRLFLPSSGIPLGRRRGRHRAKNPLRVPDVGCDFPNEPGVAPPPLAPSPPPSFYQDENKGGISKAAPTERVHSVEGKLSTASMSVHIPYVLFLRYAQGGGGGGLHGACASCRGGEGAQLYLETVVCRWSAVALATASSSGASFFLTPDTTVNVIGPDNTGLIAFFS